MLSLSPFFPQFSKPRYSFVIYYMDICVSVCVYLYINIFFCIFTCRSTHLLFYGASRLIGRFFSCFLDDNPCKKRSTGPRESISNFEKICNIFNERLELDLFIFIIGLTLCFLNGPDLSSSCYERVLFLEQFLNVFYLKLAALLFSSIVHTSASAYKSAIFV